MDFHSSQQGVVQPTPRFTFKSVFLVVIAFAVIVIIALSYVYAGKQSEGNSVIGEEGIPQEEVVLPTEASVPIEGTVCTMDAMLCPDGSSVGREGPDCEFAPCPAAD